MKVYSKKPEIDSPGAKIGSSKCHSPQLKGKSKAAILIPRNWKGKVRRKTNTRSQNTQNPGPKKPKNAQNRPKRPILTENGQKRDKTLQNPKNSVFPVTKGFKFEKWTFIRKSRKLTARGPKSGPRNVIPRNWKGKVRRKTNTRAQNAQNPGPQKCQKRPKPGKSGQKPEKGRKWPILGFRARFEREK